MMLLTLRGTPAIYQGKEIGMTDVVIPNEPVRDPWRKNVPGLGLGRDPERTPMKRDGGPNVGFSSFEPCLPVADDYRTVNVANQATDPASVLSHYRALVAVVGRLNALKSGAAHCPIGPCRSIHFGPGPRI
jgi:alpha-glucosidase